MKKNIIFITLITLFSLFLSSCDMFECPQGPAGEDGNANVTTTTFTNLVWQDDDATHKVINLTVPTITQEIINSGTIQILGSDDGVTWWTLPRTFKTTTWYYYFSINTVKLVLLEENGVFENAHYFKQAKVTVIAGN